MKKTIDILNKIDKYLRSKSFAFAWIIKFITFKIWILMLRK